MAMRPVVTVVVTLFSALAVALCIGLMESTTLLSRSSTRIARAAEEVQLAQSVRVRLLTFGRLSDLAVISGDPADRLARDRAEQELFQRMATARSHSVNPPQLDTMDQRIHAYLDARRRAESEGRSMPEILAAARGRLESALDAAAQLVNDELEVARLEQARAARWSRLADIVGASAAIVFIAALGAAIVGLERAIVHPIVGLHRALAEFERGKRASRARETGFAEIRDTARTFNATADRLAHEEQDRWTFLAGVAHDLRNPLTALRLSAALVRPDRPLPDEARLRKTMDMIGRQVSRLERMVGDFLDASRIEAGNLELRREPRDLRSIVRETASLYETSSDAHQITTSTASEPLFARCDPVRIGQVLGNLISNAIKYSPAGGPIEIAAYSRGDTAVIAVTDSGIGMSDSDLRGIFEPFKRVGVSRGEIAGVGLGLSVARKIVGAHEGRIEVESRTGAGSTFRVVLPLLVVDDAAAELTPGGEVPAPSRV